jgi:hypothetical protein
MKKPVSSIIYATILTAAFLLSGALFLSCPLPSQGDYGTLVLRLPGREAQTGARAAVSDAFSATLSCRIDCDGPGGRITRQGQAGASLSIPLNAGDWTITVTVFNAADQSIGSGSARALIEGGGTTALGINIVIDTGGRDITGFALTSPVSAAPAIVPNATAIEAPVPYGTDLRAMHFTLTHTGVSVSPAPGTALDFSSPQTFTVTAENGQTKTYTVTVKPGASPPSANPPPTNPPSTNPPATNLPTEWPSSGTWQSYGLATLAQPAGTTVSVAGVSSGALIVSLQNAGIAAFNDLVSQIETLTGNVGTTSSISGYSMYELSYDISGEDFALEMTHTPNNTLLLNVEPDDTGGFAIWPDDSRWTIFSLSGLTQPAGTTINDITETESPYAMLSVTLNSITNAAYEDLRNQIIALLGNPLNSTGSDTTQTREDDFMPPTSSLLVNLTMDTADDVIEIYAVLSAGPLF